LDAVERIIVSEESYKEFFRLAKMVEAEYQALLPDPQASARYRKMKLIKFLRDTVREALGDDTVSKAQIYDELQEILDRSIKVGEYKVTQNFRIKDLSKIDYTKLKEQFGQNQKNTIIQQLAKSMKDATEQMIAVNPKRKTLMEKLEKIMETYNKGSKEIDEIFEELIKLSQEMTDEEQRAAKEEMTEEQLAVFDLLWKEDLQGNDEQSIKRIAKELLDIIKPVIQSSVRPRENESVKAEIKVKIDTFLYNNLPTVYDDKLLETKSQQLYLYMYQHMRELV
jgi:type I restriction enzyme R subunit